MNNPLPALMTAFLRTVIVSMCRSQSSVLATALAAFVFGVLVLSPAVASGAGSGQQVTVCDYDHLVAAINAANGDTVTFACSGTITVSPPITVPSGQRVSLDSTGQGVVLHGSSDRIFDVEGGTLVLTGASGGNLVLSGGSRTGSPALGGAIFIAPGSTAELSYVSVEDSVAVGNAGVDVEQAGGDASGGAIYNDGSLAVNHSLFVRDGAVAGKGANSGGGGDASGGAIFNDGSLELDADVSFSGDYVSGGDGGAGTAGGDADWVGGVDEDISTAKGGPGGTGGDGGSAFGGAIFNGGTLTAISTPVFSGNSAVAGAGGNGGAGGKGPDAGGCVTGALGAIGGDGGDGGPGGDGGDGKGGALYTTGDPIAATFSGNTVNEGAGGDGGPGGPGGAAGSVPDPRGTCSPPSPGDDGEDAAYGDYGAAQEPNMFANCSPSCDAAAPVTTSTLSPASPTGSNGWYTAPVHVTLSAIDGGDAGVAETRCVVNPAVLPSTFDDLPTGCAFTGSGRDFERGQHTLYFASDDKFGNKESVRSVAITIDRRPPTVSLTPTGTLGSSGWYLTSVNVHTSGTDPGSGVAGCTHDQSFTNETAGTVVNGSCTDNAGLVGSAPPRVIGIDKTAPTVAVAISPASPNGSEGWYKSAPRLLVTGTDSISGIAETRCVLDPASPPTSFFQLPAGCAYLTNTQLITEGSHTLYAASKDRAGRVSPVKQVSWKLDRTAPTMGCAVTPKPLAPADHRMINVAASVSVTDALSGLKGFSLVSVSSNQPDSGLGAGDLPNDIQGFTSGTVDLAGQLRAEAYSGTRYYALKYQAQDHAGNTAYCTPKDNVPLG